MTKEMWNNASNRKQENTPKSKNKLCKRKWDASKRRKRKLQESEEKRT